MRVSKRYFQNRILSWYVSHRRRLPWRAGNSRKGRDPYQVLVSEVMLQQTQVERVIPYYQRWIKRWPTVRHLARAHLASVIKAWAGLGYNRRAVYFHKAAITVVSELGGEFPRSEEELVKLPGVGRYTARAILAFAFGKDVGVLETNTKRVLLRIFFRTNSFGELKMLLGKEASAHSLWSVSVSRMNSIPFSTATAPKGYKENTFSEKNVLQLADAVVPEGKGDHWNQALMDFGAMVCTAKRPKCGECPLRKICRWYASGRKQGMAQWSNGQIVRRVRFEETDRHFRGRIVDILRHSSLPINKLKKYMDGEHGLSNRERFERLVSDLEAEGLISVRNSFASLP